MYFRGPVKLNHEKQTDCNPIPGSFHFYSCSKNSSSGSSTSSSDSGAQTDTSKGPKTDSSKCLLSAVNYVSQTNMPYYKDPFTLTYDSLNRVTGRVAPGMFYQYSYETGKITQRIYINSVADINLIGRVVYTLDKNSRVISHTYAHYNRPTSESNYTRQDRIDYEYDVDGYLTGLKWYAYSYSLWNESRFTYQNGNLTQRENIWYDFTSGPTSVKAGADTITYTYDNSTWFPEAIHLYEMGNYYDVTTFKPNKNNVTGIQCKIYDGSGLNKDYYKTIQYSYSKKGPKLEKVTIAATTAKNYNINTSIGFGYKCD